jgi:hypothetical protein
MQTGMLSGFKYSREDPAAKTLLALDTNNDGRIDPKEIGAFAKAQGLDSKAATEEFASIDANGDGVLDSDEIQKVLGVTVPAQKISPEVLVQAQSATLETAPLQLEGKSSAQPQQLVVAPANLVAGSNSELISEQSRQSMRNAAQSLAEELSTEEKEEQAARNLLRKVSEIHSKSTALAKESTQEAIDAGSKAAHEKAEEMMKKIVDLQVQVQSTEVRAAALHAKSEMENEQASTLMAQANKALQ